MSPEGKVLGTSPTDSTGSTKSGLGYTIAGFRTAPDPTGGTNVVRLPFKTVRTPAAPGNIVPSIPAETNTTPTNTTPTSGLDTERQTALQAITNGKDPDAVKARFKQRTGQDL
jgi:hypothetical protein